MALGFEQYCAAVFAACGLEPPAPPSEGAGLVADLFLDSLTTLELVCRTDELNGSGLPGESIFDMEPIFTLGDLYRYYLAGRPASEVASPPA